jgi:hypothetical protein
VQTWVKIWREGVAPLLSTPGLEALRVALASDDPELLQGRNTKTDNELPDSDDECTGACPLGYVGWKGEPLETVGEVEVYFAALVETINVRAREPATASFFLQWVDDTPRDEMRQALLIEVNRALAARHGEDEPDVPVEVKAS